MQSTRGLQAKRKGWVGRMASEFAVGLHAQLVRGSDSSIRRRRRPWEHLEAKGLDRPAVERKDHSAYPKQDVAMYTRITELFRMSVFVWFAVRTRTKADETERTAFPKAT